MATSSITHNFFITDEAAIEESERERDMPPSNVRLLTDEQEILRLTERWQSKLAANMSNGE